MWGHYGDKHTGVCIGFERPDNDFYDLIYSKKRTKFPLYDLACIISSYILTDENPDINDKNIIKKGLQSFLTKSNDWAYEKEVNLSQQQTGAYHEKILCNSTLYHFSCFFRRLFCGASC